MATIAVQNEVRDAGLGSADVTLTAAAAGGDDFANDGHTALVVYNGGGSAITVTITGVNDENGRLESHALSVAASGIGLFPLFNRGIWNDRTTGRVGVTYSGVTSVTVGVVSYRPGNN